MRDSNFKELKIALQLLLPSLFTSGTCVCAVPVVTVTEWDGRSSRLWDDSNLTQPQLTKTALLEQTHALQLILYMIPRTSLYFFPFALFDEGLP